MGLYELYSKSSQVEMHRSTSYKSEPNSFCSKHTIGSWLVFWFYFGQSLFWNCTQTALQSFHKMSFVCKYYKVCKQDINRGQRRWRRTQKGENTVANRAAYCCSKYLIWNILWLYGCITEGNSEKFQWHFLFLLSVGNNSLVSSMLTYSAVVLQASWVCVPACGPFPISSPSHSPSLLPVNLLFYQNKKAKHKSYFPLISM